MKDQTHGESPPGLKAPDAKQLNNDRLLERLTALGITRTEATKRQNALALAAKLQELGDDTKPATLERKAQSWISGEDGVPALLGVVIGLLEEKHQAAARKRGKAA